MNESVLINRRDIEFLLYEVFGAQSLCEYERFSDHSLETFNSTIDLVQSLASDYFLPHAAKMDEHEPEMVDGEVAIMEEAHEALAQYYESGFGAATQDYELGGMQLPFTISVVCKSILSAANVGTTAYAALSQANANVIKNFASEELKAKFLMPLLTGKFMGTMALTEPQAGSSLADIRTSAVAQDDGSYRLFGNKIFISAGEHNLSDNIVHLVLARIKGDKPGTKGLSLFIVPKYLVADDGSLGERNDVALGGLIHKMGYKGTTSTMLNFGEKDGAVGYLIGQSGSGLKYMFQMMNEARIGVGIGAVALGYAGYTHALRYANERSQGRSITEKQAESSQISIIEHTDVRRMLLKARSYVEGGLHLSLFGASLVDKKWSSDEQERAEASQLLDVLTPILKSWPSKYCLEANSIAIQIHGGYGYTREYPVERLYRDNRLNPIHEGTEGIQSLDLLARKILLDDGNAFNHLRQIMTKQIQAAEKVQPCIELAGLVEEALVLLSQTTEKLIASKREKGFEQILANANLYLDAFGHTLMGWLWLQQAVTAQTAIDESEETPFYRGKIQTAQYFIRWELPKIRIMCELLNSGDDTCLDMKPEWF